MNSMKLSHYQILAHLFEYPDSGFKKKVSEVRALLHEHYPETKKNIDQFYNFLPEDLESLEELFTRSFDVQSVTTLDVGYILFGDDYKRGELLSNLNREHAKYANNCGSELADHLPNLLRLISKLDDEDLVNDMVQEILAPALKKMMAEFDPVRIKEKKKMYKKHYKTLIEPPKADPLLYFNTLKVLDIVIRTDFSIIDKNQSNETVDFLRCLGNELVIESKT